MRYYHLLLVDPPFAGRVTEWHWAEPAMNTIFFYALASIAVVLVWLGRRRLTGFDVAVLALTFAGGVNAIRGIVWFALACMVFVPVAIGHKLESKKPGAPRRRLNIAIATGLTAALLAVAGSLFVRDETWFEEYWPREAVEAVRDELDRRRPRLRIRPLLGLDALQDPGAPRAHGVRRPFRALRRRFYDRLQDYAFEDGADWKSFADGYRIVIVDETRRSHTEDFLAEPGAARALSRTTSSP